MKAQLLQNIDACIVTDKKNRLYCTNYNASNGIVVFTKNEDYFLTDFRYIEEAQSFFREKFTVKTYTDENLKDTLAEILKGAKTVGIEEEIFYPAYKRLIEALKGFKVKNISVILNALKSVKTKSEIETIEFAQSINDKTFNKIKNVIKEGITERDLSVELKYQLLKNGADEFAFEPIVSFGKNTSKPHAKVSNQKLKTGDIIMLDFGAKYNNYCSDMTRTLSLGKCADSNFNSAYNLVLKAQTAAINYIKPGASAFEANEIVREFFMANGCLENFGHGLGHGVGLDIHEFPNLKQTSKDVLASGMVLTVEPGLYFENYFGVRIEDLLVITSDGIKNLTKSDKNFVI